jgi:hypothetical protein
VRVIVLVQGSWDLTRNFFRFCYTFTLLLK